MSRPKKVILCVDDNEQELSRRVFLLETHGYRVLRAETVALALDLLEHTVPGTVDLMIVELLMPVMDGNELVKLAKAMHPCLPCLLTSRRVDCYDHAMAADSFLFGHAHTNSELLERVRILVARKRGPKKKPDAVDPSKLDGVQWHQMPESNRG